MRLALDLRALGKSGQMADVAGYRYDRLRQKWQEWDGVVKATHVTNCANQVQCSLHLYVKDGVVLREEQTGAYPPLNDPAVPDFNPKGCQKGACYARRMYDPTRLKYPLRRVGNRGAGKWQRVSWDEALSGIADTLIDVLVSDGPAAVVDGGGTRIVGMLDIALNAFFNALGAPHPNPTADNGDDCQGVALTFGKVFLGDSADNWFHSDMILVWGGNPAYTSTANYHFIVEARSRGARVVAISPDYNASAIHADLWVPVRIGSDAALALAMAQVIIRQGRCKEEFIREQTDLPLLVRADTGKFLRERDLRRGGREDVLYFYDLAQEQVAEAPRKSLSLNGLVPALTGEYWVDTVKGPVKVKPAFALLRERLDAEYTPEKASVITGVPAGMIERLAGEVAAAAGVVNISTYNWGKYYHGDLIERAIILLFALSGHMGRKGASFNAFGMLSPDTAIGRLQQRGDQIILAAAGADPRFPRWREEGYTDEMILYEYVREAFQKGAITPTSLFYLVHGNLLELSQRHDSWDPHLKRPVAEYFKEAFDRGWQFLTPGPDKEPRVMFACGGSFIRRVRGTNQVLRHLLPKLKLLVTIDFRMGSTGMYSDFVLPACGWFEKDQTPTLGWTQTPYVHANVKGTEPLYESKTEWEIFVLLARKIAQRARERGVPGYRDQEGAERRLDTLEERVTFGGLYGDKADEEIARDIFLNASNVEHMEWPEFRARGIAAYTGVGTSMRSIGNACDIVPGEPIVPLTWHVDRKQPYPTATRRIQFYQDHDWYLELGEALPTHKDPPKAGGDYPLQITGGHTRWSTHSDFADDALILGLQRGEPVMLMSVKDAHERGIRDGEEVEVHNDVASFRIQAAVSPAVKRGQVIIYHGWENYQFHGWRHFKSVMPSPLNPIELAGGEFHLRPITSSCYPGSNDRGTRVDVRKAGQPA